MGAKIPNYTSLLTIKPIHICSRSFFISLHILYLFFIWYFYSWFFSQESYRTCEQILSLRRVLLDFLPRSKPFFAILLSTRYFDVMLSWILVKLLYLSHYCINDIYFYSCNRCKVVTSEKDNCWLRIAKIARK